MTRSTPEPRCSHCCNRALPRRCGHRRNSPATFLDAAPEKWEKSELKVEEGGALAAIDSNQTQCKHCRERRGGDRTPSMSELECSGTEVREPRGYEDG